MMHLGKRPRPRAPPPMRRTTSMALLELEETKWHPPAPEDLRNQGGGASMRATADVFRPWASNASSVLFVPEPTHFLQACALCKRRLVPGKDIYMYRGDAAFCTVECRNEQIFMDEYREKCAEAARKKESASPNNHRFHQQQQNGSNTTQNTLAAA